MTTIIIICYNVFVKRNLKKIEKFFYTKTPRVRRRHGGAF